MSADTQALDAIVRPAPEEVDALAEIRKTIDDAFGKDGYRPCLIGPDGSQVELPASAFEALAFVVRGMAAGQTITLMPTGKQLTTQQAAEMLHMSRPHLIKLLDRGEIAFEKVGTHRRLMVEDVLAYRAARQEAREQQLDELSQLSQDLEGGYR
ncbi:excisionase family DNA-binding protein [Paraconexibacter algicola]|uniref:DNA-binding protein n=1 Tax=Paraconexibacter algicola TaxID=2133960 RepID=A0A2T4UL42_9ACTN|nr:helix-turn-helix domain-containing protein [Paraconexibacter algicola]PTL59959.1 DNA-binding protein [Paraconexibacter algicola]